MRCLARMLLACQLCLCIVPPALAGSHDGWSAQWISPFTDNKAQRANTWVAFRKEFHLDEMPRQVLARIAVDSKYWLWINGERVVFEGQLKRGPTPRDTYLGY